MPRGHSRYRAPEQFAATIRSEIDVWKRLAAEGAIGAE